MNIQVSKSDLNNIAQQLADIQKQLKDLHIKVDLVLTDNELFKQKIGLAIPGSDLSQLDTSSELSTPLLSSKSVGSTASDNNHPPNPPLTAQERSQRYKNENYSAKAITLSHFPHVEKRASRSVTSPGLKKYDTHSSFDKKRDEVLDNQTDYKAKSLQALLTDEIGDVMNKSFDLKSLEKIAAEKADEDKEEQLEKLGIITSHTFPLMSIPEQLLVAFTDVNFGFIIIFVIEF